jgi:hypothetical protein
MIVFIKSIGFLTHKFITRDSKNLTVLSQFVAVIGTGERYHGKGMGIVMIL